MGGGIGTNFRSSRRHALRDGHQERKHRRGHSGSLSRDVDDLQKKPITDDEIKRAKDSILNSFIFNFDTPDKVLHERMAYEFYGYPLELSGAVPRRHREGDS